MIEGKRGKEGGRENSEKERERGMEKGGKTKSEINYCETQL